MNIIDIISERHVDLFRLTSDGRLPNGLFVYINPRNYFAFRRDPSPLINADGIVADGLLVKILFKIFLFPDKKVPRQSFDFTSLASVIFEQASTSRNSVFVAGGTSIEARQFVDKVKATYKGLSIAGYMSGYFESQSIIETVKSAQPDIVLLGLGNVKQEICGSKLRTNFAGTIFTCGAFISQTAGSESLKYYPNLINRLHLRFLYRLFKEKGILYRLMRFYFVFPAVFVYDILISCKTRSFIGGGR